jgi:hypothetical protein
MTLPPVTPVPHVIRGGTGGGDVLDTDVHLVTVQKLLGHANVQPTAPDDRRDKRAKKQAIRTHRCRSGRERTADRPKHRTQGQREGRCPIRH